MYRNSSPVLTYSCLLFHCSPVDRFLRLWLFMVPVVSTDYPFLLVKWQPVSFFVFLPFRCDSFTNYATCLLIRGRNLPSQSPLLLVPGSPLTKSCHPQKPMPGVFVPLVLSFLPGHLRPQWPPGGIASVPTIPVVCTLLALDIPLIPVLAFDRTSKRGFLVCIVCIPCLIFVDQQPFDRRPCGLLPIPCV